MNYLPSLAGIHASFSQLRIDSNQVINKLKSVTIIAALASATLFSAYLNYRHSGYWWLSFTSVTLVNIYSLPKILRYGSPSFIRLALATNLTAIGTLMMGGLCSFSVFLGQQFVINLRSFQLEQFITHFRSFYLGNALYLDLFLLTGVLAYGIPFSKKILERAFDLLNKGRDVWQERLSDLSHQFQHLPEVGLGLLQANMKDNFLLQLSLMLPALPTLCSIFRIRPPDHIWPMLTFFSHQISLESFQDILEHMEQDAQSADLIGEDLPDYSKVDYFMRLKIALKTLSSEDLPEGISLLLLHGSKLIPHILSSEQFLSFFIDNVLDNTNTIIQEFLEQLDGWKTIHKQYVELSQNLIQLESEFDAHDLGTISDQQMDDFSTKFDEYRHEFNGLRTEIEKIYLSSRIWKGFKEFWNTDSVLPFENSSSLLDVLDDDSLLKEIDQTYRDLIGSGQSGNQSLCDRLQRLTNLVSLHEEVEEDPVSALMFLAANKGFLQKDCDNLQSWLNLNSPHEIEEAMEKIGLGTEQDLYDKKILSSDEEMSKDEIVSKLRKYIQQASKSKLAPIIHSKDKVDFTSSLQMLINKVWRVTFYLIRSGLIIFPAINSPYGMAGLGVGSLFAGLKILHVPGTQRISNLCYNLIQSIPGGRVIWYPLYDRRAFQIAPTLSQANQFAQGDFRSKMQMLNTQIFLSLMTDYQPAAFIRGISLSREMGDFIESLIN